MSTTNRTTEPDAMTLARRVEQYLSDAVKDGHGYFKSKEIADELELQTRQVAAVIHDVDDISDRISVEKWAYSNSTTWLVEATN